MDELSTDEAVLARAREVRDDATERLAAAVQFTTAESRSAALLEVIARTCVLGLELIVVAMEDGA